MGSVGRASDRMERVDRRGRRPQLLSPSQPLPYTSGTSLTILISVVGAGPPGLIVTK